MMALFMGDWKRFWCCDMEFSDCSDTYRRYQTLFLPQVVHLLPKLLEKTRSKRWNNVENRIMWFELLDADVEVIWFQKVALHLTLQMRQLIYRNENFLDEKSPKTLISIGHQDLVIWNRCTIFLGVLWKTKLVPELKNGIIGH